jgi:hypothetical protein
MSAQVANTTISSLKRLIEEKNRIIERYERKLADTRTLSRKVRDRLQPTLVADSPFPASWSPPGPRAHHVAPRCADSLV